MGQARTSADPQSSQNFRRSSFSAWQRGHLIGGRQIISRHSSPLLRRSLQRPWIYEQYALRIIANATTVALIKPQYARWRSSGFASSIAVGKLTRHTMSLGISTPSESAARHFLRTSTWMRKTLDGLPQGVKPSFRPGESGRWTVETTFGGLAPAHL